MSNPVLCHMEKSSLKTLEFSTKYGRRMFTKFKNKRRMTTVVTNIYHWLSIKTSRRIHGKLTAISSFIILDGGISAQIEMESVVDSMIVYIYLLFLSGIGL